jgi:predicted 2-oxoglutarate/Fe(II)-dependent dioxygenase YbiX
MNQTLGEFVDVINEDVSDIVEAFNQIPQSWYAPHEWYDAGADSNVDKPCTSLIYQPTHDSTLSYAMFAVVDHCLHEYTSKRKWPRSFSASSTGRMNIYRTGDSMDEHIDHIHTLFTPPSRGIPALSIVGLLNDDFEGGAFTLCGEELPLKVGDIALFPSCFLYPHSVGTVTAGTRLSFVSWAW